MEINVCGVKFNIEKWWRFVSVDENGEVSLFYEEPKFEYWNGYHQRRFWDTGKDNNEWKDLGFIDKELFNSAFMKSI